MTVIVVLYIAPLLFKASYTLKNKMSDLNYQFNLDGIYKDRLKRSVNHVTAEEACRITNESSAIVQRLITLGTKAHTYLHHLPPREGDVLLTALTEYNTVLTQFIDLIKHDNINTRADVDIFLGQKHPNIAETDHLEWDARTRFNWADSNYTQFKDLMYTARQLWIELIYIHAYY